MKTEDFKVHPKWRESSDHSFDIGLIIVPDSKWLNFTAYKTVDANTYPDRTTYTGYPAGWQGRVGHAWFDTAAHIAFEGNEVLFDDLFGVEGCSGAALREQRFGSVGPIVGVFTRGATRCENRGLVIVPEIKDWIVEQSGVDPTG